jgi:hypothetical protein
MTEPGLPEPGSGSSRLALAARDRQTPGMGLKELFQRWTKGSNAEAIARAEAESGMTPYERDVDQEDFEGRKQDLRVGSWPHGAEAEETARNEFL